MRRFAPLALALVLLLNLACRRSDAPAMIRLASLLPAGNDESLSLRTDLVGVGADPVVLVDSVDAARIHTLELTLRGTATLGKLSWKLDGERRHPPYRSLSFALRGSDSPEQEQTYRVELGKTPYWVGRVEQVRLAVEGGGAEVVRVGGVSSPGYLRDMAIDGVTIPALAGVRTLEVPLPESLPLSPRLEVDLGLVPEFVRPGVQCLFRVSRQAAGGAQYVLFEERMSGDQPETASTWRSISVPLDAAGAGAGRNEASDRLLFEVVAERYGTALPEGVAFWGAPRLVGEPIKAGRAQAGAERLAENLVIIVLDTLRADAVGSYGNVDGLTPNLDRFAEESVRFENFYAPSPWTLPSVVSLLTGLSPQSHGAGIKIGNFAPTGLDSSATTLAEVLAEEQFATHAIYHNIYLSPTFGVHQGFDRYASLEERADVLVDRAFESLDTLNDRRFFLYLHIFDVHNPYEPLPEDCEAVTRRLQPDYEGALGCAVDRRPGTPVQSQTEWAWIEALYKGEVAGTDREVGRFLEGLAERGLDDDTAVLVVGDHGEDFYEHLQQMWENGYRAVSDHGHNHYEELLRVPAILRLPGRQAELVDVPTLLTDLFPTMLSTLGIARDRWPVHQGVDRLAADAEVEGRPSLLFDRILHGPKRWAIRRGPYKLVVPDDPVAEARKTMRIELYDLERDPGERINLAAERPDLVESMLEYGEALRREQAALALGNGERAETYLEWNHITKLRSLGYLQ